MPGSVKGRVLSIRAARASAQATHLRLGVCAWCAADCTAPQIDGPTRLDQIPRCLRCGTTEIDWAPPPAPPEIFPHLRDTYTPGTLAYSVLGGTVHGHK